MPPGRTTSLALPRKRPQSGKVPPSTLRRMQQCPEAGCVKSFHKKYDLGRHILTHLPPGAAREEHEFTCPHPGCPHKTLQRSNMNTHVRSAHTGETVHACPDCRLRFTDPAVLTLHRRQKHDYVPRRRGARRAPASTSSSASSSASSESHSWDTSSASSPSTSSYVGGSPSPEPEHPRLYLSASAPAMQRAPSPSPEPTFPRLYLPAPASAPIPEYNPDWLDEAAFAATCGTDFADPCDAPAAPACSSDFDPAFDFDAAPLEFAATHADFRAAHRTHPYVALTPRPGTTAAYPAADLALFLLHSPPQPEPAARTATLRELLLRDAGAAAGLGALDCAYAVQSAQAYASAVGAGVGQSCPQWRAMGSWYGPGPYYPL
ncbi:hypothetical protein B0H15DRAFT_950966 [Mycena belliarum]|uniref:C2H2-type domain-containing protein n=1 Tax=Mycena belliarum TaxID=1033014 RepID=A0AAD6U4B1_9AGAR|nr:hypothetical protein B0H15DRAFT_950966 [Mycena belliae]